MNYSATTSRLSNLFKAKSYSQALALAEQALEDSKKRKNYFTCCSYTSNISQAYMGLGKPKEALLVLSKMVDTMESLKPYNPDNIEKIIDLQGVLKVTAIDNCINASFINEAIELAEKTIKDTNLSPHTQNRAYNKLVKIAFIQGNLDEAIRYLQKSSQIPNIENDGRIKSEGLCVGIISEMIEKYFMDNQLVDYLQNSIRLHTTLNALHSIDDYNKEFKKINGSPFIPIDDVYYLGMIYYKRGLISELKKLWDPFMESLNRFVFLKSEYVFKMQDIYESGI